MTHDELLASLGLSGAQLSDTLQKFHNFFQSLDDQQKAVVQKSIPSLTEAANSFGPDVQESELRSLLEDYVDNKPLMCFFPMVTTKSE